MWSVYLITCVPTGKQYVGVTSTDLGLRWARHVVSAYAKDSGRSSPLLIEAIRNHGAFAFSVEALRTTLCYEKALMLEAMYARQLKTLAPDGLNLSAGGHKVISQEFIFEPHKYRARVTGMAALWKDPIKAANAKQRMKDAWQRRKARTLQ